MKLIGTTTETIEFQRHIGQHAQTELLPAGTLVEINSHEMEENPNFFHVELLDTDGRVHTYISRSQVEPA